MKLVKELNLKNMSTVLCAIVKTISVIVCAFLFLYCLVHFRGWIAENISPETIINFLMWLWVIFIITFVVRHIFITMYQSCEESNKTTKNHTC